MSSYHYFGNEGESIPEDIEELVVHPLVPQISERACECFRWLTRVNFSGSVLSTIGKAAFNGCVCLLEIEIPRSVTTVGTEAFMTCQSLTTVRFHEDGGLLTTIGSWAFADCSSLAEVSIPSSVETIGQMAFGRCRLLTRVSLREGLKIIDMAAFMECVKLEQMEIPKTLEILGQFAFHRCFSLQEVNMEEGNLRVIGQKAFERCFKLHTISIPSTVESIERKTFKNCDSLRVMKFQNGLKSVADEAFYSCKNLQAVALPGSVESIGLNAFAKCPKLVSLELGDGSRGAAIQNGAFEECSSLTNICLSSESRTSPSSPEDHGERINSFRGCTALEAQYGETNISLALGNRFENLPVHKKCYHASVTTADELAREIESSAQSSPQGNPTHAHLNLVDPFGMTPFHILLSAANCRLDLLQVLVDAYPPHVLGWTDAKGKTAIDYYRQQGWNLNEDSRRILQLALDGWLVGSISSWNGLEVWKSDMSSRVNAIVAAEYDVEAWKSDMWSLVNGPAILAEGKVNERERQLLIEEAPLALLRYERMEASSLLELSLWKMEMKTATGASTDNATRTSSDKDEREAYRIRCGASVLIPNVTTFLCETSLNETNRTKLIGLVIPGNPASIVTPVAGSNKSIVTEIP